MGLLKDLRKKHNLTQAQLAAFLHTSQAVISRWEQGSISAIKYYGIKYMLENRLAEVSNKKNSIFI